MSIKLRTHKSISKFSKASTDILEALEKKKASYYNKDEGLLLNTVLKSYSSCFS